VLLGAICAMGAAAPVTLAQPPPDGRGYELVSPSAKLGNDVIAESSRTRAAARETPGLPMAATFTSLGGFADVRGMGVSTEYLAQRTAAPGTSGWTTHAITPPQQPLSILAASNGLDPLYEGELAPDLTRGVFRAWSPLTDAPSVEGIPNLYLREDLRSAGAGSYRLLTAAAAPPAFEEGTQRPYLAATSADLEHAIFESRFALTPDAVPGNVMLYKVDHGVVRLLAPGPTCPGGLSAATPCAIAGAGATTRRLTSRALSADGARVTYASPVAQSGGIVRDPATPSLLYQLDDLGTADLADDVTLQVNASEKTPPDPPLAARFETASTDGERVFFTSGEQLTDTPGSGLYLWRRTPDADGRHLTLIGGGGAATTAAVGASEDGRRVYFVAAGQLIPDGPPVGEGGLYLWQDADGAPGGTLSFVGAVALADAAAFNNSANPWNIGPSLARVTPDGRTLLFEVSDGEGLAPQADHGSCTGRNPNLRANGRCSEAYVYRADSSGPLAPDVVCASCPAAGVSPSANAFVNARDGAGAAQVTAHLSHALSDDGRRVLFSTAQPLVREDVNDRIDAYEYDVPSRTVHLISSGRDAADAWFLDASASGDDVLFVTRERLVGWDVDASYDLYDARVGGGLPEPVAEGAGCSGDACRGAAHTAPAAAALASAAFVGARRAPAVARRCRRGSKARRVHGKRRCVRVAAKGRRGRRPARKRRRR
jgi:hypothetical protein